jgi:hypothetical protein
MSKVQGSRVEGTNCAPTLLDEKGKSGPVGSIWIWMVTVDVDVAAMTIIARRRGIIELNISPV